MYRIYSSVNCADTCRDPDDIHITELGYTADLDKAKEICNERIKKFFFRKDTVLQEYFDGFIAQDFCSYGATLRIDKLKVI